MKKILPVLAITGIFFSACQKDSKAPVPASSSATTTQKTTSSVTTVAVDDTTKGYLRVQMAMNANATDDILIEFNPASSAAYVSTQDATSFAGFGAVSLSSLSSNGIKLAINSLPLLSQGTSIGLVVNAKATGVYNLNLTTINAVPGTFDIWLKDKYKKDSLDFRKYPSYAFNLNTSDTTTFGSNRFSLVLRAH